MEGKRRLAEGGPTREETRDWGGGARMRDLFTPRCIQEGVRELELDKNFRPILESDIPAASTPSDSGQTFTPTISPLRSPTPAIDPAAAVLSWKRLPRLRRCDLQLRQSILLLQCSPGRMVWVMRDKESRDGALYMSYEVSLFTIKLHHSGSFLASSRISYVPDVVHVFDYCDYNELCLTDLHEMCTLVGHLGWVRFYSNFSGLEDCPNMISLDTDEEVKNLIRHIDRNRVVDVYVETVEAYPQSNFNSTEKDIFELDKSESFSNEEDTDESDSSFSDDFVDADFEYDDMEYDENIDEAIEWVGLKESRESHKTEQTQMAEHYKGKSPLTSNSIKKKSSKYQIYQGNANETHFDFEVGLCFTTADEFREAIRTYANMQGKPIKFSKNCSDKIQVTCECGWQLYASFISKSDNTFQVKTIKGEHTCFRTATSKHCTSDYLANKYQNHLRSNPEWLVHSMQEMMQMENRTSLSIWKMYRTKKHANKINHGTELEQYASLWNYCEEIRQTNPNTTIKIQCKQSLKSDACIFKRLYICWGALKVGFLQGCRPIIGLDGTHLKTTNGGVLLCAVGVDGNNGIYPVAYAMVRRENGKSWEWFIGLLIRDLNIVNNYAWTIMSDKQKGLIRAVQELLPNAEHRFCLRHMYGNFKQIHKGLQLKNLLWKAASASRIVDFNTEMEKLRMYNIEAYNWVRAREPKNWARSHFSTWPKCDMLLNNLCECFNNVILRARGKPIITMLEIIRVIMMRRLHTQRDKMLKVCGDICPNIQKILETNKRGVHDYILEWNGNDKFEVKGWAGDKWTVELNSQSCSCHKWDLTGIPCVHAIACIFYQRERVEDYVDYWYKKSTYLKAYEHMMNPIKGQREWPCANQNILVPWNVKKKAGRPSLQVRRKDADEVSTCKYGLKRSGSKYACSNCGATGHNKKSCGQASKNVEPTQQTLTIRSKLPVKMKSTMTNDIATQESITAPFNQGDEDLFGRTQHEK
ncbi:hypothetical protein KSP39_PZI006942 [Platanthera zijinensis]|uniref:SWIM-type domain-containing protein n=1 Tax=Platanthera zijinensis TaxID=2320716 RepID=A0AAP0BQC4_9ASPA